MQRSRFFQQLMRGFALAALTTAAFAQRIEFQWDSEPASPSLPGATDELAAATHVGAGRVLAAVHSVLGTRQSAQVRLHDEQGNLLWNARPRPIGARFDGALPDGDGGAFLTGVYRDLSGTRPTRVVATRFDAQGNQVWIDSWQPASFSATADRVHSALDASGGLWLCGTFSSGQSVFARRLSANGAVLAHTELYGQGSSSVTAVASRVGGGVVTVGQRSRQPFVRVFGSAGQVLWHSFQPQGAAGALTSCSAVAVEASTGRIAACGTRDTGLLTQGGFLLEFEPSGALRRAITTNSAYSNDRSSLDCVQYREDGLVVATGARQDYGEGWSLIAYALPRSLTAYAIGGNYLPAGPPWPPAPDWVMYPGQRLVRGSAGNLFLLAGFGPAGQSNAELWVIKELDWNLGAAELSYYGWDVIGPLTLQGLCTVPEGLLSFGHFRDGPDGSQDAYLIGMSTRRTPTGYCSAPANSQGCVPYLGTTGDFGPPTPNLVLIAGNLTNQSSALAFFSTAGALAVPFSGGVRCVAPPVRRGPVLSTGGSPVGTLDCSGQLACNLDALAAAEPAFSTWGSEFFVQVWSRDAGTGSGLLTSALRLSVQN